MAGLKLKHVGRTLYSFDLVRWSSSALRKKATVTLDNSHKFLILQVWEGFGSFGRGATNPTIGDQTDKMAN